MRLSVVVPTKNRPDELRNFLASLWAQQLLPDQLIIIDQSKASKIIHKEVNEKATKLGIKLDYIHDESINGLVQAKAAAIPYNKCSIISFFDDDIVLEADCLKEMAKAFEANSQMTAANGLILNAPKESFFRRLVFELTHFGLYKDNRRKVFYQLIDKKGDQLLPQKLNALSGGLTFYKKEIFEKAPFDVKNRFHAYEDKEHSVRVALYFPDSMYLIPRARLYHYHAASNRESDVLKTKNDTIEVIKMFKKYKYQSLLGFDLIALLLGLLFNATFKALRHRKGQYIANFFKGIRNGFQFKIQ